MRRHLEQELREKLSQYVSGQMELQEFKSWFVPRVWNLEATDKEAAEAVANQILLALAEHSNGDWTEEELRSVLQPLTRVPST